MQNFDWVTSLNDRDLLRLNYAVADALQRINKSKLLRPQAVPKRLPKNVVSLKAWKAK
jgi:hypothetical protein